MDSYLLVLRVLHIVGGILWAGGGVAAAGFINPTAKELKGDAAAFMAHFNYVRRFPLFLGIVGFINVVTGVLLYYRLFGDQIAWGSGYTIALTLGSLFGLIALGMALGMLLPTGNKLEKLVKEIGASGGPPSPEQAGQIAAMQGKLMRWAVWVTTLTVLGGTLMAANEAFLF
ncbi:MAG: hypothetical protein OEV06_08080 [Anaerolineae bacterium]|nr:hypothetical protein [Anaerolineae bacterium]